mgnify:FL=1
MNIDWLHTQNALECIVFCNGWGMDIHAVQHLKNNEYDICVISNYDSFQNELPNFTSYSKVHLIAWSMGVWAASKLFEHQADMFDKKIAINGTGCPIHNTYGINEQVFIGTLTSWNDSTRKRFDARMCGGNKEYAQMKHYMSARTSDNQQKELQSLYNAINIDSNTDEFVWTAAIIGEQDMIFTSENQKNYWSTRTKSITLPVPHFPFHKIETWKEILEMKL